MLLSMRLQKLHIDSLVVLQWMVFLKTKPFEKQNNTEFTSVSSFTLFLMYSIHFTLSWDTSFFPSPPATIFSCLCILKSPDNLPGIFCLGPLGVIFFSGHWRSSELDSLRFWTSDIQDLPTSCRKFLYFTFLFVFSVLYPKIALESAQFSRYNATFFFIILQFSSGLSNNWGTGLPCLCPSWIYCTGQQHNASLFPRLFSWLPFLCLQLLCHGL